MHIHPSSESLRVKVKDGRISITFNVEGWYPGHTDLIDSLARDAESSGIPVAQYIGEALELLGEKLSHRPEFWEETKKVHRMKVADGTTLHSVTDKRMPPIGKRFRPLKPEPGDI